MLQINCTASWNTFETALQNLGVVLDPKVGSVMPRLMRALSAVNNPLDPATGKLKQPYLNTLHLSLILIREATSMRRVFKGLRGRRR